jgi:hypothetical protein
VPGHDFGPPDVAKASYTENPGSLTAGVVDVLGNPVCH